MTACSMDLYNPFNIAKVTSTSYTTWSNDGTGGFGLYAAGTHGLANSNDGFTIYASSGTLSGTIQVYGYR